MQEEKISVIIPVYNCEKYLERAVDSVVGQTYNNLQIILVDDGSTDKSSAICDSYTTLDKRIMVIHQNNQGVSAARNMALEMADGDFVMFLDSDDYLEKDACEILHDSIAPEESMCMCGHYIEKEHGGGTQLTTFPSQPTTGVYAPREALSKLLLGKEIKSYLWNKLFRRVEIGGLRFNPDIRYQEDFDFMIRFCLQAKGPVRLIGSYLYHYIERNNSLTHNQKNRLHGLEILANGILTKLPESPELIYRYSVLYLNECTAIALLKDNQREIIKRNCRYIRRNIMKISHLLNKGQLKKMVLLCISFRLYAVAELVNQKKRAK